MHELSEVKLKRLQECELIIANEVKRICNKKKISYFLIGGSLLGEIRHKGFIPWDDDMDIGFLREDYERFCRECETELSEGFVFQTWDTDEGYPFSFGKIRLSGTHIEEQFAPNDTRLDGIYVDIFPFDNAPDSLVKRKMHATRIFVLRRILWMKKGYGTCIKEEGIKQHVKYNLFKVFSMFWPYTHTKNRLKKVLSQYDKVKKRLITFDGVYPYMKNTFLREWLGALPEYEFEGLQLCAPENYDDFLKQTFGDYMMLPPIEERRSHGIKSVSFGDYYSSGLTEK